MNLCIFLIDELLRSGLPPEGPACFYQDLNQAPPRGPQGQKVGFPIPFSPCSSPSVAVFGALRISEEGCQGGGGGWSGHCHSTGLSVG